MPLLWRVLIRILCDRDYKPANPCLHFSETGGRSGAVRRFDPVYCFLGIHILHKLLSLFFFNFFPRHITSAITENSWSRDLKAQQDSSVPSYQIPDSRAIPYHVWMDLCLMRGELIILSYRFRERGTWIIYCDGHRGICGNVGIHLRIARL